MTFREATDAVSSGISHSDLADKLGVSVQRVRQARLDPDADGYRPPPPGWKEAIIELAQDRGAELFSIAKRLR